MSTAVQVQAFSEPFSVYPAKKVSAWYFCYITRTHTDLFISFVPSSLV
jgi:hypothetical protein